MSEALRKAAEMALKVLTGNTGANPGTEQWEREMTVIAALRAALAEPEQTEPVDFDTAFDSVNWDEWRHRPIRELVRELHKVTAPPRREPLTKDEITALWNQTFGTGKGFGPFARAIEAAHGIGGKEC